ncbi:FAD-binding domain-containing protein [Xylariaceae sp. FL0016]|nr:FAD-binding domain-containing protein [Xylariaceae sp. FL0016]
MKGFFVTILGLTSFALVCATVTLDHKCKVSPGDDAWPTDDEWSMLNQTIDGSLLQPKPAAAACYPGPDYNATQCRFLVSGTFSARFWIGNPLIELSQWTQGSTCVANTTAKGNCTQGGFPEFVVNATTVKHIQAAVNFARNKNIRLVIKNTGHDFGGRSTGAGSISVWVHYLKEIDFLPEYTTGAYAGMAVRMGAGVEAWEVSNFMAVHNITVVAAGGNTVGGNGGWLSSGGHSLITSKYGLGSDQALSFGVVTADGDYVTADPFTNADLFWALRGGGGATYGIVISVILKAYPPVALTGSFLMLSVSNATSSGSVQDADKFWEGVSLYYRYCAKVLDTGGYGFSYIYPMANNTFRFMISSTFPGMMPNETQRLMQPVFNQLQAAGINATNPKVAAARIYGSPRSGLGDRPNSTRYRSRLLPRQNWEDDELWDRTMRAIRKAVEGGYENNFYFHGTLTSPTEDVAGWPGTDSAVHPSWRENRMHAMLMDTQPTGLTAQQARDRDAMMQGYMDLLREVSPGSGSYMNEGDPGEPNWQQAFYGSKYERLLEIKRKYDPWNLFWAPTTVGSEGWAIDVVDGYPNSQNGRLCRVAS